MERSADLLCATADNLDDGRLVASQDDRNSRLDDPRLLRGDLLDRVAEPVAMVESDLRDDAKRGFADIGRIKTSAESAFEDRVIDLRLGVELEGNGRKRFEKGSVL